MENYCKIFKEKTNQDFLDFYKDSKNYYTYVIYMILKDIDLTNDMLQDGYIKMLNHIDTFNQDLNIITWGRAVMLNNVFLYIKNRNKIKLTDINVHIEDNINNSYIIDNKDVDDIDVIYNRVLDIIHNELSKKPKLQQAVVLKDIEKLSLAEISEILGENLNTIKSRVKIGRDYVKKVYNIKYNK